MDRRSFLTTGATAALLPLADGPALAVITSKTGSSDAKLNATFDQILQERVQNSPTLASSLGLDKGPNAALKAKFDTDPAPVARAKNLQRNRRAIARLRAISPAMLSDAARLNREVVLYSLETSTVAPSRWNIDSVQRPYPITQQGGAYFSTPDFLNTTHTIENAADRLARPLVGGRRQRISGGRRDGISGRAGLCASCLRRRLTRAIAALRRIERDRHVGTPCSGTPCISTANL